MAMFSNYPMARYATDAAFQPAFRPSGSFEGGKYYSGNHKLYGYGAEVPAKPNGFAVGSSMHEPGSVSDLVIFRQMQWFHSRAQRKKDYEALISDNGPMVEQYPNQWEILADKGYPGAGKFCRITHLKRKPQWAFLSPGDVPRNMFISSHRILVENYFGRLCGLWAVLGSKMEVVRGHYDPAFRLCLGLTNFHKRCKPLRDGDMALYQQLTR